MQPNSRLLENENRPPRDARRAVSSDSKILLTGAVGGLHLRDVLAVLLDGAHDLTGAFLVERGAARDRDLGRRPRVFERPSPRRRPSPSSPWRPCPSPRRASARSAAHRARPGTTRDRRRTSWLRSGRAASTVCATLSAASQSPRSFESVAFFTAGFTTASSAWPSDALSAPAAIACWANATALSGMFRSFAVTTANNQALPFFGSICVARRAAASACCNWPDLR